MTHECKSFIYINSANRLTGTDSAFSIEVQYNSNKHYDRVAVMSANIPKCYYAVPSGRNTFTLVEGASNTTITVTPGTYTRGGFATYLSSLLSALSPNHYTYKVALPNTTNGPETGYYYYTVTGNGATQPSFVFSTYICQQMGFVANSTNTFIAGSLTSTVVTNLAAETSLYLHSDICWDYNSENNILQDIYTNGYNYNSYISYTNPNIEFNSKPLVMKGNVWSFWLTDENGQDIFLNGSNMVITLCLFREPLVYRLVENYILYKVNKSSKIMADIPTIPLPPQSDNNGIENEV